MWLSVAASLLHTLKVAAGKMVEYALNALSVDEVIFLN